MATSGAILSGLATGATVTATPSTKQFIVTKGAKHLPNDVEVVHRLDPIKATVVRGSERSVKRIGGNYVPDIEYTLEQPAAAKKSEDVSDEPSYSLQWDKQDQQLPKVHEITRGSGTRVAVIDSGVAADHPDLSHAVNVELSRDFTGDGYGAGAPYGGGHGTHVAGIIAANDRNDTGVVGTAPATEIVDCRVLSRYTETTYGALVAAMLYSAEIGCDVANLSVGAYPVPRNNPEKGKDGNRSFGQLYGKLLNHATAYVRRQGTLLVSSAGNEGADLQHDSQSISLPSEAAHVMSIGATGPIGFQWGEPGLEAPVETPAVYTNYGTNALDLSAPGGNESQDGFRPGWYRDLVFNCVAYPRYDSDGTYRGTYHDYSWKAGTSMAAPQVVGAAALLKSQRPGAPPNQLRSILKRTASVPEGYDKAYYGAGYLDTLEVLTL